MGNQINEVIDNLCNKFCVTSTYLVNEMARYYMFRSAFGMFVSLILLVICSLILKKNYPIVSDTENNYSIYEEEKASWFFIGSIIITFIVSFIFLLNTVDFVGYLISPTAAVIDDILSRINS